jgi:hypothetical protein
VPLVGEGIAPSLHALDVLIVCDLDLRVVLLLFEVGLGVRLFFRVLRVNHLLLRFVFGHVLFIARFVFCRGGQGVDVHEEIFDLRAGSIDGGLRFVLFALPHLFGAPLRLQALDIGAFAALPCFVTSASSVFRVTSAASASLRAVSSSGFLSMADCNTCILISASWALVASIFTLSAAASEKL